MDKRRSGEELDGHSAKRRKSDNVAETPEMVRKIGLEVLDILKKTTDKTGRIVSTHFLTLPNKRLYPDYYNVTKMPIALDTIHAKLQKGVFKNVTELESYFKRMIQNARDYNTRGSEVFEDAERLRKALSNLMREHNPAYKLIPNYAAVPTPLPKDGEEVSEQKVEENDVGTGRPHEYSDDASKKPGPPVKKLHALVQRSSATPALSDYQYANVDFEGLTFQKAQEKIVEDAIREKEIETDEFAAFQPFLVLPSRTEYKDYYRVIKNPVSLNSLQKKVKGAIGRSAATGISEFKSWAAFEDEASYIWRNAYMYNQDGSDFYMLAKELEHFFKKRFAQAKAMVAEPTGTKLKIKMQMPEAPPPPPPKITLKFVSKAATSETPGPQPVPTNDNSVPAQLPALAPSAPSPALAPFAPAVNGNTRQNPFRASQSSATPMPNLGHVERATSISGSVSSPTTSGSAHVKNEDVARNSPTPAAYGNSRGSNHGGAASSSGLAMTGMPPPLTPGPQNMLSQGGYAQSFNHQSQYQTPSPNPSFESKWRQPGKTAADAMITNLCLASHPGLNITRHFRMDLPPSPTMAHQSITINLPSTHYYLQIKPTLAASTMERQHKLFVTSGFTRLHAMPNIPGHAVDQRHPLFEARLTPGVNRIDIELIAALPKGSSRLPNGQDVELEKIVVFANLLR